MKIDDLHALAGVYALDALDDEERLHFEAHLLHCEPCQQEVAEYRATAAELSIGVAVSPAPAGKAAVMAQIAQTRQESPPVAVTASRRAPLLRRWALPAAASMAVIAVALGGVVGTLQGRVTDLQAETAALSQLLAAPDVEVLHGLGPGASTATAVVSVTEGRAVVDIAGMAPAPAERIYQVWFMFDNGVVPAGIFDVDADGTTTQVLAGDLGGLVAVAVTVEPPGGSDQPTSDPVLVIGV